MKTFGRVVPFLLFALIVLFLLRIPLFDLTTLISNGDLHRSHYFFWSFIRDTLSSGQLPLWNPYVFSGYPFLSNPSVNLFYPGNWFLLLFPLQTGFALHMAFHLWFAMAGMYVLLSKILRSDGEAEKSTDTKKQSIYSFLFSSRPVLPSCMGAIVFGLSGVFASHIYGGNYDVIAASSFMPWTFFACYQAFEKWSRRWFIIVVGILSLQILSGYITQTVFTLEAVGVAMLLFCIVKKTVRPVIILLGIFIASVGLTAFQLIPMQQNVALSVRSTVHDYSWAAFGQLPSYSLSQLISPFILGDQHSYLEVRVGYWEHACFMGRLTLLFAVVGLSWCIIKFFRRKKNDIGVSLWIVGVTAGILVVFALWVALAFGAPIDLYYLLWKYVPGYSVLRIPSRHLLLFVFGMSILSGIGAYHFFRLFKKRYVFVGIICALVLGADMYIYAAHQVESRPLPESKYDTELVRRIKTMTPFSRIAMNVPYMELDSAMRERYFSTNGYDVVTLKNYFSFVSAANNFDPIFWSDIAVPLVRLSSKAMQLLGVEYLLVDHNDKAIYPVPTSMTFLLRDDINTFSLYKNNDFLPRFFVVPSLTVLSKREDVYDAIRRESVDYTKTVFVSQDETVKVNKIEKTENCVYETNEQSVHILSYAPNKVILQTTTSCDAYLSSSEVMYPGWTATIDGTDVELFEGNLAFRTMVLPKGKHTIVWEFKPKIFLYGGIVSIATLVLFVFLLKKKNTIS